jgi:hypothetical protein
VSEATGVEIPRGSPGELRAAGEAWTALAGVLDAHTRHVTTATTTLVGASWSGEASSAYATSSVGVALAFTTGAAACRDAAATCRQLAHDLQDAQQRARRARHQAEQAIERRDLARRHAEDAEARIVAADAAAISAAHRAAGAAASGPTGASALATAQADGRQAANARAAADDDRRRAENATREAEHDLRDARRRGEDAGEDAERAGRSAARAFADVVDGAQPAPVVGGAMPASYGGTLPGLGGPLLPNPFSNEPFELPPEGFTPRPSPFPDPGFTPKPFPLPDEGVTPRPQPGPGGLILPFPGLPRPPVIIDPPDLEPLFPRRPGGTILNDDDGTGEGEDGGEGEDPPRPPIHEDPDRNPAQDKPLSDDDIELLKDEGYDAHDTATKLGGGKSNLFKDRAGNVYEKDYHGQGRGEPLNVNLKELRANRNGLSI